MSEGNNDSSDRQEHTVPRLSSSEVRTVGGRKIPTKPHNFVHPQLRQMAQEGRDQPGRNHGLVGTARPRIDNPQRSSGSEETQHRTDDQTKDESSQ